MTFKHVKFEDSPTMRALEKVAREKGLVKPEPLNKRASLVKKADLTPTDNLMENIVRLCAGLREQGRVKDASELETNYLLYKQAQTIYETSKETGEDVLEFAHPEGSHKLVDVDSDEAVVEDLLDKHEKTEEVAESKPDGKLTDAFSVINAVKLSLAQADPRTAFLAAVNTIVALFQGLINSGVDLSDWHSPPRGLFGKSYSGSPLTHWSIKGHLEGMIENLNDARNKPSDVDAVKELSNYLSAFNWLVNASDHLSGDDKATWLQKSGYASRKVAQAISSAQGNTPAQSQALTKGNDLKNRIQQIQANPKRNASIANWANSEMAEVQQIMDAVKKADDDGSLDAAKTQEFMNQLNGKEAEIKGVEDGLKGV